MPVKLISDYLSATQHNNPDLTPDSLLLAEANHRIANNLSLISGMLRLQASDVAREGRPMSAQEVCALLEEAGARIQTVGRLHRLLAEAGESAVLDLHDYLRDIAEAAIQSMALVGDMTLEATGKGSCEIRAQQALPVGVIVGELVTNAVKYSHPARVKGRIAVTCESRHGGTMLIQVADDGVGFAEGFDPMTSTGLGMRMVRNLASQLGARLSFESTGVGLTVRLLVPPARPVEA